MWCLKAKKTQILIEFLEGMKKVQLVGKKSFLRLRGFRTWFLLLTTPYVMFESKKTQILIEFLDDMKKVQLVGKKSFLVAKKSLARV